MAKKKQKPALNQDNGWSLLYKELEGESDRAAAIVGATMLDELLSRLLTNFLIEDHSKVESLFEQSGPLATFSAKISLAYCLGLISVEQEHDLGLIRKVRNHFAHQLHGGSFQDDPVVSQCRELKLPKRFSSIGSFNPARQYFTAAVAILVYKLGIEASRISLQRRQPLTALTIKLNEI